MKKNVIKDYSLSIIYGISFALFIFTLAIAVILFYRPIFYMSLSGFDFKSDPTYTYLEVKNAYNDIMDSMVFFAPFKEGVLPFSESAEAHFLDCQKLFLLSNLVCLFSGIIYLVLLILNKKSMFKNIYFKGISFRTIFASLIFISLLALVIYVLIDENAAFAFFHSILFPGKTNWLFDPSTDPIINYFTLHFFLLCGAIIFIIFVGLYLFNLIKEIYKYNKRKKAS